MSEIYIDVKERRKIATKWIQICLFFLHLWGSGFAWAVINGSTSIILEGMFSTVCFGIGATLIILLFDDAAPAIIAFISRFTGAPLTKETVQTTRVIEPANTKAENNESTIQPSE